MKWTASTPSESMATTSSGSTTTKPDIKEGTVPIFCGAIIADTPPSGIGQVYAQITVGGVTQFVSPMFSYGPSGIENFSFCFPVMGLPNGDATVEWVLFGSSSNNDGTCHMDMAVT